MCEGGMRWLDRKLPAQHLQLNYKNNVQALTQTRRMICWFICWLQ